MGLISDAVRGILACVAVQALVMLFLPNISASPNLSLDTERIYLPHELDELLQAAAYENCKKDPNCDTDNFLGTHRARCSLGAGGEDMFNKMVINRDGANICNPFTGEVIWPTTGQCVTLLTQGPCPPDSWVKLTVPELVPVCEPRPCRVEQALTETTCTNIQDSSRCPAGMALVNNEFGEGECDCIPGTAYHTLTGECHKPYSRGPCPEGQIIKVIDTRTIGNAECFPNICPEENMVMINNECQVQDFASDSTRGTCYFLGTRGPCTEGTLTIDEVLLEPLCLLQTEPHSIFNLPNIRGCPRGSIRDSQGRCRQDFSKVFGRPPPIVTSRPGTVNGTICPKGQLFLGGFCYRLPSRRGNNRRPTPTPNL